MNSMLLKSKMVLHGDNQQSLAKVLDISESALSQRINGIVEFPIREIRIIKNRYILSAQDVDAIFICD